MEIDLFNKSPSNPPLPKGENARKDSRQAGMTKETKINFIDTRCLLWVDSFTGNIQQDLFCIFPGPVSL